jgi:hypothetical protein
MAVFWDVAPCGLVEVYQRFRGTCCLHHQGRLKIFENRLFTRISGPKMVGVTDWRKLHDEVHRLYSSDNIRMGWTVYVARTRKVNAYKMLVGKPEGKKPLGRPRRKLHIEMVPREMVLGVWMGFIWLGIGTGGELL